MAVASHAHAPLLSGIYAIVDSAALAAAAVRAGVRVVQYRVKDAFGEDDARAIRDITRGRALFILNDRWEHVERFDADGVHVGPDDVPLERLSRVKETIGARILGASCANVEEAALAAAGGADYIGVGSVFATSSKPDAGTPIGIEALTRVVRASALPVAAIGGITLASIPAVKQSGAAMAAVIGAISGAPDPHAAAAALVRAWNAA